MVRAMKLGSQPWLRAAFLATALVFVAVATYVYGFRYFAWLESDAAVPALLAAKSLHSMSPVVTDWYYANGDLWVVAPHLIAMLPVAIIGVSPVSLLVATVLGFALEIVVLVKVYARLAGAYWIALFAAMATLMAWSNAHVAYAYVQLAYAFAVSLSLLTFYVFAALAQHDRVKPLQLVAAGLLLAVVSVGNPARNLVYVLAPVLAGCLWPWRMVPRRRRISGAAAAICGWLVGYGLYSCWLARVVAWSLPRGHVAFVLASPKQILENLVTLGRGLLLLCAAGEGPAARAIPGALLVVGALVLVSREVLSSRTSNVLRWLSVVVVAQLGVVLVPLLIGNVLDGPPAVRYVMPSLLTVLGLAVVIAIRSVMEARSSWWRRIATGWLAAVPVVALIAATDAGPPAPVPYVWPDAGELDKIADELVRRGLTHGFAGNLAANLLTLDSDGKALTCRITTHDILAPERWLADTSCYTRAKLPDRFYVVVYQNEGDRRAVRATLPTELQRFTVGKTYEIYVFRTDDASTAWLDLPIPDGELATFPLHVPATYLQLRRDKAVVESGDLAATGEPGTVVYGPYIELPKGAYTATWTGNGIESPGQIVFYVTGAERDAWRNLAAPITREAIQIPKETGELVRLPFTLKRAARGVEFKVESRDGARVALHELVVERLRSGSDR
jgi:hypothetical protein